MAVVTAGSELSLLHDSAGLRSRYSSYTGAYKCLRRGLGTTKKPVLVKQPRTVASSSSRFVLVARCQSASVSPNSTSKALTSASVQDTLRRLVFASSSSGEGRHPLRKSVRAKALSVVTETRIGSEVVTSTSAAEEAMALAKAAANAARDAAAYAEALALAESVQYFPSEQDLLLLERARLTEMAKHGSVLNLDSTSVLEGIAEGEEIRRFWEEVSVTPSELDSELSSGVDLESHTGRTSDDADASVLDKERTVPVAVKSSRRKERLLKRERAMLKAEQAATMIPPSTGKVKKYQPAYDPQDPVRSYFKDIGRSKLLTPSEEIELAEGIQDLLKMEAVKKNLSEQLGREPTIGEWARAVGTERHSLESRLKAGQASKDRMVNSNLRLVVSIARKYQGRGMRIQDLIQEGCLGLIRGAEKFDHTRGFKFSTYAHWWIRQAITRAIADQSRTIRLPVHVYELLSRITKARNMLSVEHGRPAKDEEVAEMTGLSVKKLKMVLKSARSPRSMELPVGKTMEITLGEVLADREIETPEEAISKRLLKQDLDIVLRTLSPREREVLRLRYGLDDGKVKTLEEIGTVYKVTRERIRQIEAKAMRKLRQPSRNSSLRNYLDLS